MKQLIRNSFVVFILFIGQLAYAQQVIVAEYFWDTDPGQGNGTTILALDGNLNEAIEALFTNSVSIPSPGLHKFNIRIKGLENTWGNVFSYAVNVTTPTLISRDLKVIQAEYFWDTDPGEGNATPILALDGNLNEAVESLFNGSMPNPSAGLHKFNIRVKGLDNAWGNLFSYVVNVSTPTLVTRDIKVIQAEYFWDTDPGQGNATTILAFDGNLNEAVESLFNGSLASPSSGLHTFNIRVKGLDATWSPIFSYVVNVSTPTLIARDAKVIQAEYFWDADPGLGNGTVLLALDGNLNEAIENLFSGAVPSPSPGLHNFNVRVKALDNSWSNTFSYVVNVGTPTLISRNAKVIQAEYFWDVDPGQGNASPILALDGNLNEMVEQVFKNTLTSTSVGMHVFHIRVKGFDNNWSTTFRHAVSVLDSNSYTTINPIICAGSTYTVPSGSASYTVAGIYSDTLINANGFDSIITINLFVDAGTSSSLSVTVCGSYLSPSGNTYTSSGTYINVIPNSSGCDSTITINLTILPNTFSTINVGICDSYTSPSGNYIWTNSGTYLDTIPNASSCDSIITINLTISTASTNTQTVTSCNSYTWSANGLTYTTSGTHTATLLNAIGCDSIVTLNLTIHYGFSNSTTVSVCNSYTWPVNGMTYTFSGNYSLSLFTAEGCDSSYHLNLTIRTSSSATQTVTACNSYFWPINGLTYMSSGTYLGTIPNAVGCDSVITLDLTIKLGSVTTTNVTACNSYTWPQNAVTYTSSGVYSVVFTNSVGCDSIITLNLNLGQHSNTTTNVSACNSYFWSATGLTYTTSGLYTTTIVTAQGCNAVMNLNLVINYSASSTQTISACESFTWPITGATYTSSGTYFGVTSTSLGCDSTITLNLTIKQSSSSSQSVTACNSYLWPTNGLTYTNSGIYTATLTNAVGCDSIVTLNLTVGNDYMNTSVVSACGSYLWAGTGLTYTTSGFYTANFVTIHGCDSILNLNLTVGSNSTAAVTLTGCDLYTWPLNGNSYASSGIYFATIPNASGCDSIVTLYLTILHETSSMQTVTTCNSYLWPANGTLYTASGNYTTVISNVAGCDSTITLNLTLDYGFSAATTITACNSYTWPQNGLTYTNSGSYSVNGFTSLGCDSSYHLNLTIVGNSSSVQNVSSCGSYTWPLTGNTYATSGSYSTILTSASGCDSTVTLNLTINTNSSSTQSVSTCGSYFWSPSGTTYTNSGIYTATIPNAAGCDSLLTLNLSITSEFSNTTSVGACASYTWGVNGATYTNSGSYTALYTAANGCDSTYILNLTIGNPSSITSTVATCNSYFWSATGQTYSNSGTYSTTLTNSNGCDSVLTLNLTINNLNAQLFQSDNVLTASPSGGTYEWLNCTTGAPVVGQIGQEFTAMSNADYAVVVTLNGCSDTSNCVTVSNADIDKHFLESIALYPNPTDGKFTIDLGSVKDNISITLRDVRGRLIQQSDYVNSDEIEIELDHPAGMYFVEIISNSEKAVLRVVKK